MTIPITSTENKPLEFSKSQDTQKYRMPSPKIGWLHTKADQPGARFNIVIKDSLGRKKLERLNCGNETKNYGELVNLETMVGEDLEISIESLEGAERLEVFVN